MDPSMRPANLILLSIVNSFFFIIGLLLNSIVIICLLRSNQHLKRLSSFMILILSCFDLATIIVCHPLIITSAYVWSTGDYEQLNIYHRVKKYSNILFHFSFMTLLVMNIDRFLAVSFPFFHKQKVTRRRLMALLGVFLLIILVERVLAYRDIFGIACYAAEAVLIGTLLVVIFVMNYKMYKIAKTAQRVASTGISVCILAVACFILFFAPLLIYSAIQFVPETLHQGNGKLFSLWATTFACMNSSVNCLLFFWKDRKLCHEGAKLLKSFINKQKSSNVFETDSHDIRTIKKYLGPLKTNTQIRTNR